MRAHLRHWHQPDRPAEYGWAIRNYYKVAEAVHVVTDYSELWLASKRAWEKDHPFVFKPI